MTLRELIEELKTPEPCDIPKESLMDTEIEFATGYGQSAELLSVYTGGGKIYIDIGN